MNASSPARSHFRLPTEKSENESLLQLPPYSFALEKMADDFERAILYAFDHTGAVGPELKVKKERRGEKKVRSKKDSGHSLAALSLSHPPPPRPPPPLSNQNCPPSGPRRRLLRLGQGLPRGLARLRGQGGGRKDAARGRVLVPADPPPVCHLKFGAKFFCCCRRCCCCSCRRCCFVFKRLLSPLTERRQGRVLAVVDLAKRCRGAEGGGRRVGLGRRGREGDPPARRKRRRRRRRRANL